MELTKPRSLDDVITDGLIAQAAVDDALYARTGPITQVELNGEHIRVHGKATLDARARVIARVSKGRWQWYEDYPVVLPQLQGSVDFQPELLSAARTLHNHAPVIYAPQGEDYLVVKLEVALEQTSVRRQLALGLASCTHSNLRRALIAYATWRQVPISFAGSSCTIADTTVDLKDFNLSPGMSVQEAKDNALLIAAEHAQLTVKDDAQYQRRLLAIIEGDRLTWSWAHPHYFEPYFSSLRETGIAMGISAFFLPTVRTDSMLELINASKLFHGWWTHRLVDLDEGIQGVEVLDSPELHLPLVSSAAARMALQSAPRAQNPRRAVLSYARFREIPAADTENGVLLTLPGAETVMVGADGRLVP